MTKQKIVKHLMKIYPDCTIFIRELRAVWVPADKEIKTEFSCYITNDLFPNYFSSNFKTLDALVLNINIALTKKNKEIIKTHPKLKNTK